MGSLANSESQIHELCTNLNSEIDKTIKYYKECHYPILKAKNDASTKYYAFIIDLEKELPKLKKEDPCEKDAAGYYKEISNLLKPIKRGDPVVASYISTFLAPICSTLDWAQVRDLFQKYAFKNDILGGFRGGVENLCDHVREYPNYQLENPYYNKLRKLVWKVNKDYIKEKLQNVYSNPKCNMDKAE